MSSALWKLRRHRLAENVTPAPIVVETTHAMKERLKDLTATGFYGRTIEETALQLLADGIRSEWLPGEDEEEP